MDKRKKVKWYIIYPENSYKNGWDLFIGLILIVSCTVTPYHIAFYKYDDPLGAWEVINVIFDITFAVDIIASFVSSYYDEDFYVVDDLKIISCNYLRTWFIIDIVAIFPFDIFQTNNGRSSGVIRVARIGRMWKLVKLTRLIRFVKIVKQKATVLKKVSKVLNIDSSVERLMLFLFMAIMVCHIQSCLWVFFCGFFDFKNNPDDTFISKEYLKKSKGDQYLTSMYFIITTFSTVGYGDISASNSVE